MTLFVERKKSGHQEPNLGLSTILHFVENSRGKLDSWRQGDLKQLLFLTFFAQTYFSWGILVKMGITENKTVLMFQGAVVPQRAASLHNSKSTLV